MRAAAAPPRPRPRRGSPASAARPRARCGRSSTAAGVARPRNCRPESSTAAGEARRGQSSTAAAEPPSSCRLASSTAEGIRRALARKVAPMGTELRRLLAPLSPATFLERYWAKEAVVVRGTKGKFATLFDKRAFWRALNEIDAQGA